VKTLEKRMGKEQGRKMQRTNLYITQEGEALKEIKGRRGKGGFKSCSAQNNNPRRRNVRVFAIWHFKE
jgi:hypothetical protein